MTDQQDITDEVRLIVENAQLLDASSLENMPELRAAKKLKFSAAEFHAMRRALRSEKVLTVAELHDIIAETKRKEDEAAKAAELDGSLLIGGIYLFDQEAPLDLSKSSDARVRQVLDYENLSDDEPESDLKIDDERESGRNTRASLRSVSIPAESDSRPLTSEPIGDDAGNIAALEDDSSDGELDDSEPGEAEEVVSVAPEADHDRKAYLAWSSPNGQPLKSSAPPTGPAIPRENRINLVQFLDPIWTTKSSTALVQLRTPDGRAEVNAHIRGRQAYLPELDKYVILSHMAKQPSDVSVIHAPQSPPYTLRKTYLSQLYMDRKIPLDYPKLMPAFTDSGIFPLERLFVSKGTPLQMLSTIPTTRKPKGPPSGLRFDPTVPPPTILTGQPPTLTDTQFPSQWSTVVSRRSKPRSAPAASAPSPGEAPSTSAAAVRPPRIVYVQPAGKRSLPHDCVKCDHCGHVLKLARH